MQLLIIFVFLLTSNLYADQSNFLTELPVQSFCDGSEVISGQVIKSLGRISIQVHNSTSNTPMIEVSNNKDVHFKIGDGFRGKLTKSSSCAYYFSKETMFYLCGLVNPGEALTLLDVQRVENKSSFSRELVCQDRVNCIRLSNCSALK